MCRCVGWAWWRLGEGDFGAHGKEFGKVWGERDVFPAMTGMDFAFLLEPAPRHDGPDPSFRYSAGAGRPRLLGGPLGAKRRADRREVILRPHEITDVRVQTMSRGSTPPRP